MRWKPSRNKRSFPIAGQSRTLLGLLICSVVCLLGADPDATPNPVSSKEMADRRSRIKEMSETDRNRLENNLSRFLALPTEQQAELIDLYHQLNADPSLQETQRQFEDWVSNLTPWQRKELTSQKTVDGKLAVVEAILDEHRRQREESQQLQERVEEIWAKHWDARPPRFLHMETGKLDRIIAFLEQNLPDEDRPSAGLSKPTRRIAVFLAVLDHYADREDAREEPIPLTVFEQLKRKLPSFPNGPPLFRDNDKEAARSVTRLLAGNVLFIGYKEILDERPRPKNHEELLKFVDQFGEKYRREFEAASIRSRSEAFEKLSRTFTDLYFEQKAPDFRKESDRLRDRMRTLGLFGEWPPRRGGRGGPDREGRGPGGPKNGGSKNGGPDREDRRPDSDREDNRRGDDNRFRRPSRDDR